MLLGDKTLWHCTYPIFSPSHSSAPSAYWSIFAVFFIIAFRGFKFEFFQAPTMAAMAAIAANFWLNNILTYFDHRLRGWRWWRGLLTFYIVCSVGAITNIAVATFLYEHHIHWLLAALAGIGVGAVWNYALSSVYTWD